MTNQTAGFCPFRIQKGIAEAGCVLQLGQDTLCYSQDPQPLRNVNEDFVCPLLGFSLSNQIYQEMEELIRPILAIQDLSEIAMNLWPFIKGIANPRINACTEDGKILQERTRSLRGELEEILCNMT